MAEKLESRVRAQSSRSWQSSAFTIFELVHPPGQILEPHRHPHVTLCVPLDGGYVEHVDGQSMTVSAGELLVKGPELLHEDRFGNIGCTCLRIDAEPSHLADADTPLDRLFSAPRLQQNLRLRLLAAEVCRELRARDAAANLALESLGFELLANAARAPIDDGAPEWMARVEEMLNDRFREDLRLADLAAVADVTPAHLGRRFRKLHGCSVGEYIRELRTTWALQRLQESSDPVARIAVEAGFYDQSHLGRTLRRLRGITPGQARRSTLR